MIRAMHGNIAHSANLPVLKSDAESSRQVGPRALADCNLAEHRPHGCIS